MTIQSACFAGPRAAKLPYAETSAEYGRLEAVLKAEIIRLVREGVSEFYTGGQTGVDTLAALLVLQIKEELGTTANLHLVLPYRNMPAGFSALQKDAFEWTEKSADTVTYLHDEYAPGCYRERNRYMVDRSDYLIAVAGSPAPRSGTHMAIGMAGKKGIAITLIHPLTYEIKRAGSKRIGP
jgi:uncharacterized phage-like protein YoqJ